MIGLPLAPCHRFPSSAPAGFFSVHAMKDPALPKKLAAFIAAGRPTLITKGLAQRLEGAVDLNRPNVHVIDASANPERLLHMSQGELDALRAPLLKALGASLQAPARVSIYLFDDSSRVVENFNDAPVTVTVNGETITLPARGWNVRWADAGVGRSPDR